MAIDDHLMHLRQGVGLWNWWRGPSTDPDETSTDPDGRQTDSDFAPDLSEADLSEMYLLGANLRGANLRGSNLSKANLCDANIIEADLSGANLQGAKLRDADLTDADLTYADLRDADLQGAHLAANLKGADLRGAYLTHTQIMPGKVIPERYERIHLDGTRYDFRTKWPYAFPTFGTKADLVTDDEAPPASLREIAETVAAYIGIPALLLYPLGLFVVALRLYRMDNLHPSSIPKIDFITAWYASSLVPNVVIAGHGAKAFLLPLLVTFLTSYVIAKCAFMVSKLLVPWRRPSAYTASSRVWQFSRRILGAIFEVLGIRINLWLVIIVVLMIEGLGWWVVTKIIASDNLFVIPASVMVGVLGGILIYFDHYNSEYRGAMKLSKGLTEGWIRRGLALAYILGLVAVLITVYFVGSKNLPDLEVRAPGHASPDLLKGLLLGHSGGYWYVLAPEPAVAGVKGGSSGGGGGGISHSEDHSGNLLYVSDCRSTEVTCAAQLTGDPLSSTSPGSTASPGSTTSPDSEDGEQGPPGVQGPRGDQSPRGEQGKRGEQASAGHQDRLALSSSLDRMPP